MKDYNKIKLNNNNFDTEWNGWYTTDDPSLVINAFESVTNQPDDYDLIRDPGLVGAVYYSIYELQMHGMDEATVKEIDGGLYMYHEDTTFGDFCEYIKNTHGVSIEDKITGRTEEALENAEEI